MPKLQRGQRITAMAYNFDGRHGSGPDIYPPEDKGPFVGVYDEKVVKTPWGAYTQYYVYTDDGGYRLVERTTIKPVEE